MNKSKEKNRDYFMKRPIRIQVIDFGSHQIFKKNGHKDADYLLLNNLSDHNYVKKARVFVE